MHAKLRAAKFYVDVDLSHRTLNKMIREGQTAKYNYILVVGAEEAENGTANVRTRDNTVHGVKTIDELIAEFTRLCDEHVLDLELDVTAEKKGDAKDAKKGK